MDRVRIGSVHGRFQPFHNGHLDYVLEAFEHAEFLWVGLTQVFQPRSGVLHQASRELAASNPLTFRERSDLVEAALLASGIPKDRFQVTPFPIEMPERLHEFVPIGCMCFTTLVSDWNDEKVRRLTTTGFRRPFSASPCRTTCG